MRALVTSAQALRIFARVVDCRCDRLGESAAIPVSDRGRS